MNAPLVREHAALLRTQMEAQRVALIQRNPPFKPPAATLQNRLHAKPASLGLAALLVCVAIIGPREMIAASMRTGFNAWIRSATRQAFPPR